MNSLTCTSSLQSIKCVILFSRIHTHTDTSIMHDWIFHSLLLSSKSFFYGVSVCSFSLRSVGNTRELQMISISKDWFQWNVSVERLLVYLWWVNRLEWVIFRWVILWKLKKMFSIVMKKLKTKETPYVLDDCYPRREKL